MTTSPPRSPVTSTVPAPPQGPGADVPFAAPPRDPDKSRMAVGIVVAIAALIVMCGGIAAGAVGVLVWSSNELSAQSREAADDFLQHIVEDEYDKAYESLCEPARDDMTQEKFTRDWTELDAQKAKTVAIQSGQQDLVVRSEVTSSSGSVREIDLTVALGQQTMNMQVCGWKAVQ